MKEKGKFFPNLFLVGIAAIVAIVALVLYGNSGGVEGASVNKVQVSTWQDECADDDPDNDFFTPGKVKYGYIEYVDWCTGDGWLGQWECDGAKNVESIKTYECPNGCLNGACLT